MTDNEVDSESLNVPRKFSTHKGWLTAGLLVLAFLVLASIPTGGSCASAVDGGGACETSTLLGSGPIWPFWVIGGGFALYCLVRSRPQSS